MDLWIWILFFGLIGLLLALDLGVFHRKPHAITTKEALGWSAFWVALALAFNGLLFLIYEQNWSGVPSTEVISGKLAATLFFTAYVVEKSLSIDNIFVIAMIFSFFKIPLQYQHRLLFWGVFGAIVFRGIMIYAGVSLVREFSWLIYVLGALLLITAVKMLVMRHDNIDPNKTMIVRGIRKFFQVSDKFDGQKLFTRIEGRLAITPMGIALILVEAFDVLFAVDSVPAVMAITLDPFIIFTSNVFAILGLRSLYFALAGMMDRFRYLKMSLVFILAFVGVKMIVTHHYPIHPMVSLLVIFGILGVGVVASITSAQTDSAPLRSPLEDDLESISNSTIRGLKKVIVLVVGSTLLLIGTALLVLPGPGVLVLLIGLALLATEFIWAKLWLDKFKKGLKDTESKVRKVFHKKEEEN